MSLTIKQELALKTAVERYRAGEKYTIISGYAGSGKTYVIKYIVAALGIPENKITYIAYTGKAAKVLSQKGCPNATTAHKLLYYAKPLPNGSYKFVPKPTLEYDLILIDEVSMLPKSMWDLLISHNCYIIACGDPGQLPPVDKSEANDILARPHVFLDEIMRQAQESEIIRLSMHVREGKPLSTFTTAGEEVKIISPHELVDGMYEWADQILCATNKTRHLINTCVRELKGFGPEPCAGDRIISLRNHWDLCSSDPDKAPLTNGSIGYLTKFCHSDLYFPPFLRIPKVDCLLSEFTTEGLETYTGLYIDYKSIKEGEKTLSSKQEYEIAKRHSALPLEFAYAYAITGWKAQGDEWDKVLAFEEPFPFDALTHKQYLYSCITRAKKRLVLVKK